MSSTRTSFTFAFLTLSICAMAQCPKLIWSDEFDGNSVNASNWSFENGDGCNINLCGWGNNELQYYQQQNTTVANGLLTIIAKKENVGVSQYTSSRLKSINKVDIKYGRIEARLKMPVGQGIWPAFWMLPTDKVYGEWPQSGELDIMEYLGHEPNTTHGTLHYGNLWPNNLSTTASFVAQGSGLNEDFHEYVIEWKENSIKWFVDGYLYSQKKSTDLLGQRWPFDQRFHFLLNLAVGGGWPGNPNASTVFPQTYAIDYIRVYDLVDQPYLTGAQKVDQGSSSNIYQIINIPANATTVWSIPSGAEITSSSNGMAVINMGNSSGEVKAEITTACGTQTVKLNVKVEGALAPSITLEDFDTQGKISKTSNSGNFTDNVSNPLKNAINGSNLCGKYVRSSTTQYDILVYSTSAIPDASKFLSGEKKLYIDIYSTAPIGTTVLLQFENINLAQSTNYPVGRHSRYQTKTQKQNEWERLELPFLDRPDASLSNAAVNQLIFLFAPNSLDGSTFYMDNFQVYERQTTSIYEQKLLKSVMLHPVPASEAINIVSEEEEIDAVQIYDMVGKLITAHNKLNGYTYKLVVQDYKAGQYIARVTTKQGHTVSKPFLKQ